MGPLSEVGSIYFAPGWSGLSEGMLLSRPVQILSTSRLEEIPHLLAEASRQASAGVTVAGYLAYEAGAAFEKTVPFRLPGVPLLWMGCYEEESTVRLPCTSSGEIEEARFSLPPAAYKRHVETIWSCIREGDVYQINFTAPLDFRYRGTAEDLFTDLLRRQVVPYAAYMNTGDRQILSLSPELFFERSGERILTRPMKGTVRRGDSAAEDRRLQAWLSEDEKSRAENLMIVDLLRNDLSRVCRAGSVRVPSLFTTERYETLIQMTSEVEGRLLPHVSTADIFHALFPCGSVTGAPKIRAMQLIHDLEPEPRGAYCGAIGFMRGDTAVFNVAIRTITLQGDHGRLGVGSGIVWDSDPAAEYEECLLKARFLTETRDFKLIETMRWEGGRIELLDLHLERLERSAGYFSFPFNRDELLGHIDESTSDLGEEGRRVRLTLAAFGEIEITVSPIQRLPEEWEVTVSDTAVDPSDVYRRHKTTRRALYEAEFEEAGKAGFDEVLFLNLRGELAEGSRTNIIVVIGDAWHTPPVSSGALPGVFREHLLRSKANLRERVLYIDDLADASEIYLCNAVVGLVRARVVSEPVHEEGR